MAWGKACVESPRPVTAQNSPMPDGIPAHDGHRSDMADSIPLIRQIVRHLIGTVSVMLPEGCPPSRRNPVRHGPAHAANCRMRRGSAWKAGRATQERDTPEGNEAIDRMLITDLPVRSRAEGIEKLDSCALRRKIEEFHKIMKSGCKAEESSFEPPSGR